MTYPISLKFLSIKSPHFHWHPITILILLIQYQLAHGHPNGAPPRLCKDMRPEHGEQSMNSDLPFTITLDRTFVKGLNKIKIDVTSPNLSKYTLAGVLFVVKRPNSKERAYGSFDTSLMTEDLKTVDCFGRKGSKSGLTHTHPRPKMSLSFHWIAPNDTSGEYELHATLVRDFNSYWADYIHPRRIIVSVDAPASTGIQTTKSTFLVMVAAVLTLFNHFFNILLKHVEN